MNNEQRLEVLEGILEDLSEMSGYTIIVEGINDKKALTALGVNLKMVMVQQEGGPIKVSERLYENKEKAIIMTDWDDKGNTIAKELERNLASLCVPFDNSIRSRLKDICVKDIKDVESLYSLYLRISGDGQ